MRRIYISDRQTITVEELGNDTYKAISVPVNGARPIERMFTINSTGYMLVKVKILFNDDRLILKEDWL